jgi:Uma2 family endonuclease
MEAEVIVELSAYEQERGKPMPSKNHAIIQSNLVVELTIPYRDQYRILSEVKLNTPPVDTVPDVAIYPLMEFDSLHDETKMDEMPLGAIEIISPSQGDQELVDKIARYFDFGVKSCWLVQPTFRIVTVFSSKTTFKTFIDGELHDTVLDIKLDLKRVFR